MTKVSGYPSHPGHPGPVVATHSETTLQLSQESGLPNPLSLTSHNNQNHSYTNLDDREADSSSSTIEDFEKDDHQFENEAGPGSESVLTESDEGSDKDEDLEKQVVHNDRNQEPIREKDPNLVEWNGQSDPGNPMNWSRGRKWMITLAMGSMTWVITFASSVFSTATIVTAREFHTSEEVMILGTSLFVLGFVLGPIMWGPLSELYGRKIPLFTGYLIFAIFQIPVAVAQNLETIFICRFLGGVFGCAPLAVVGGAMADFWGPVDRGIAVTIFGSATFIGPIAGPIVGGFITMSHLGWRWTAYITTIMAVFFGVIGFFLIPETYAPVLLQRRAKNLRYETKNWALHSKLDEQRVDLKAIAKKYLLRPFKMLFLEPILVLITLYMALVYGIIYLFFEAYPIAFSEMRGWNEGVGALPFLALGVGVILGGCVVAYTSKTRYARKLTQTGRVVPEERLVPMIIGGAIFPIGMFWFAWTSSKDINPWPQIIAGVPIGMGVLLIFLQGFNYIIDVYLMNANSAIAANTLIRSSLGAAFPLFATGMYHNLGVNWATSLLGFLAIALFPVPILFYIYGNKIRKLSRYSPTL